MSTDFLSTEFGEGIAGCETAASLFAAFQQKAHSLRRRAESEQASSSDKRDAGIAAMSVPLQIQIDVQRWRIAVWTGDTRDTRPNRDMQESR